MSNNTLHRYHLLVLNVHNSLYGNIVHPRCSYPHVAGIYALRTVKQVDRHRIYSATKLFLAFQSLHTCREILTEIQLCSRVHRILIEPIVQWHMPCAIHLFSIPISLSSQCGQSIECKGN